MKKQTIGLNILAAVLTPGAACACACGCGVFDVGTSSLMPERAGGTVFLNYDYQNQNQNWSGTSSAPGENNEDKKIETHTVTLGLQYMFNRSWGAKLELPFVNRTFDSAANAGSLNWSGLGDLRLRGIYTGFSDDLSTGLTFGLKLPTGSHTHTEALGDIDRDTQIGRGSTDILLGGFHRGSLAGSTRWNWFAQAQLDLPMLKQGDYRPGLEADAAAGIYYDRLSLGCVEFSPVVQVIGVWRGRDNGAAAAPDDSGYQRVLLAPGIEFNLRPVKIYADVEIPVYQNISGNQLIAPVLFKVSASYTF
ncbi:MAG: hypothetical protein WCJ07_00890 [Verrucomicrobiota bacterium]